MSVARSLERRIEHLVEGLGAKVFRGQLHPLEVAIRLIRECELNLAETGVGPTAPNQFVVSLSPDDLGADAADAAIRLNTVIKEAAFERGWRLEGAPAVTLTTEPYITRGTIKVDARIVPGELHPWAHLIEIHGPRRVPIKHNRAIIGRSRRADVILGDSEISRTHALVWQEGGGAWIQDLASANGTLLNNVRIDGPSALTDGDSVTLGVARFGFRPT